MFLRIVNGLEKFGSSLCILTTFLHFSPSEIGLVASWITKISMKANSLVFVHGKFGVREMSSFLIKFIAPELCYKRAFDMLKDYQKANDLNTGTVNKRAGAKWDPPPRGFLKINVEAAINKKVDIIGLGLIVRDSDGSVLLFAARSSWPVVEAERAEIAGFKWAANIVKEKNWCKVVVEGDA